MNALLFFNAALNGFQISFGVLVLALLGLILYFLYRIAFPKKSEKPVPDEDALDKILFAKERRWFFKFVNGPNPKFRTVTLNQAIFQAIMIQEKKNILKKKEGIKNINNQPDTLAEGIVQTPFVGSNGAPCVYKDFDLDRFQANDVHYENYVVNTLGINHMGAVCPCDDVVGLAGGGPILGNAITYCNWESDMFQSFVVDITRWNLTSIEVFDCPDGNVTPQLLSSTGTLGIDFSPTGNFAHFTMSNPTVLDNLQPGDKIKVVFKWLEQDQNGIWVRKCIVLENQMGGATSSAASFTDDQGAENGQAPKREVIK